MTGFTEWFIENLGKEWPESVPTGSIYAGKKGGRKRFSHLSYRVTTTGSEVLFYYYYDLDNPVWATPVKRAIHRVTPKEWKSKWGPATAPLG